MARQFQTLGDRGLILAFDTAPPQGAGLITLNWALDFPVQYIDSDMALLLWGVTADITTSATAGTRRIALSFQTTAPTVEFHRAVSIGTAAANLTRRFDFQTGQQVGAPGSLLRESLPDTLYLFPGHVMVLDIDGRLAGDVVNRVTIRGRLVRP